VHKEPVEFSISDGPCLRRARLETSGNSLRIKSARLTVDGRILFIK
jgi:hypothetical protein